MRRVRGDINTAQLMQACSIMLSSSIDTSIISHVFDVLEAGNTARFSPRYTSSAVLYASELYIYRCAQVTSHHKSIHVLLQRFTPTNSSQCHNESHLR